MNNIIRWSVVIITGASSGLGREIAIQCAKLKYRIIITGRSEQRLYETRQLCKNYGTGAQVVTFIADLTKQQKCKELIDFALKEFNHINMIFLNAGANAHFHFSDITSQEIKYFKSLMDINFYSNVYLTKYALPTIRKFKGKIVVISSLSGKFGLPQRTAYCASKFALTGFFQSLRTEENASQVGIHLVFPTSLNTQMRHHDLLAAQGKHHENMKKDDTKRFDPKQCSQIILQKINKNVEDIYIPFKGQLGVMVQPFFPKILRQKLKKQAKL